MKNQNPITILILILITISFASASCTLTLDKITYSPTETAEAEMSCNTPQERSQTYTLNWTYQNGTSIELDTGTTPGTTSENFYQSYTIPSTWPIGIFLNATLQGTLLEGTDSANVSGATANSLLITNAAVGGKWLGLTSSVQATAKNSNGKKITGGLCKISGWNNDETTMLLSKETAMFNGEIKVEGILEYTSFDQEKDYAVLISCYCGSTNSATECIDEDGNSVNNSIGTAKTSFTTNDWVTVWEAPFPAVYSNGTDYPNATTYAGFGEKIFFKANVTNNYPEGSIEIKDTAYLINNETGSIFEDARGNTQRSYSVPSGNKTILAEFEVPSNAPTGVYFIRNFFNTYYNNLLVSQAILQSETFNVTGTSDSFQITQLNVDKTHFYTGEYLHTCANITNNFDTRVEFEISYNYRCGSSNGNFATGRSIIDEQTEFRAVSAKTSQYQCAKLEIPYANHLLYKTSQCYASVTLQSSYINTFDNKLSITSSQFNITDYGMYPEYEIDTTYPIIRLFPDWKRFDDLIDSTSRSYYRAKINVTKLNESYLDPNDEITDNDWDIYILFNEMMPSSKEIYNYTVTYENETAIENIVENKELNWKTETKELKSSSSIGIENINFSDTNKDYFIIKVWFEDFEERSVKSLEALNTSWNTAADALVGIENKTGTFHLDVQCPSSAELGTDMNCSITGQIEDEQTLQKEVDFTCYITGDGNIYSSINFNQMINKTSITLHQIFPIPTTLTTGQQYTLQCHADYYNLGSRRDSFYDTFSIPGTTSSSSSSLTTGWGSGNIQEIPNEQEDPIKETSPITGGIIGTMSIPSTKTISIAAIILVAIVLILYFAIPKRKYYHPKIKHIEKTKHFKLDHKILLVALNLLALIIAITAIIFLVQTFTSLGETSQIIQDPLLQKIIFITFLTIIVIVLFKALNIQINISFNNQNPIEKYWKQVIKNKD